MPSANNLQSAIRAIISQRWPSARALAQEMQIDHSIFSRLETHRIDPASLAKILAFFSARPNELNELIRAHIWDELARAGIDAAPFWKSVANPDLEWYWELTPGHQGDFEVLAKFLAKNPSFSATISGLANAALVTMATDADRAAAATKTSAEGLRLVDTAQPVEPKPKRKNGAAPSVRSSLPLRSKAS